MVLETDPPVFLNWIGGALESFLISAAALGLVALVVGFLITAFRYGPLGGGDVTYRFLRNAFRDLIATSPRRILALTWLAVQESLRRRVLVGFAVFLLILLFAGWFLDPKSDDPAKLYLAFVLTATNGLVLLIAALLSVFSLPADIKNRTIYTIVTKPVRAGEIVLGRILGFTVIGTLLLAVMGLVSYVFVVRLLNHTHQVEVASLRAPSAQASDTRVGRTNSTQNHRHQLTLDAEGNGSTDMVQGHYHDVTAHSVGDKTTYVVGPPQGLLAARVPAYGALRFKDRGGKGSDRGISVGKEWKYHSYVEGATLAAAVWTFSDVTPERYPHGLPIEMTIRVFRSYKGDIEKGIRGSLVLKNPRTGRSSAEQFFVAKDFYIDRRDLPRKLTDPAGKPLDLFDDLAPDGELEVWLQCLDDSQYFGVAKADLYLRARDASFTLNFVKSYLGIWVQMLLVTSLGVMFSTFLSGPVAMLATLGSVGLGFKAQFIVDVAKGAVQGGGPVESFIRIIKQQNVTTQLEPGLTTDVVQAADRVLMSFMTSITGLLPNFNHFDNVNYLAHGFDIPPDVVLVQICTAAGYLAALFAIGYFFLKTREVAR